MSSARIVNCLGRTATLWWRAFETGPYHPQRPLTAKDWATELADIFQEVEEDVRRERFQQLWKRYGRYVGAAAIAIVLVTAGVVGWREIQRRANEDQATRFLQALDQAGRGEADPAKAGFAALAQDGGAGYATLARLQEAALLVKAGDVAGAVKQYEAIAADSRVDQVFRDLAVILVVQETIETADPAPLQQRLQPLLADKNPWRHSATELSALLAKRAGDAAKAKELYTKLADDLTAPQGMRARATEMLAIIGG